jgi:hypothetical protein
VDAVYATMHTNMIKGNVIRANDLPADLERFVEQELARGKYASRERVQQDLNDIWLLPSSLFGPFNGRHRSPSCL